MDGYVSSAVAVKIGRNGRIRADSPRGDNKTSVRALVNVPNARRWTVDRNVGFLVAVKIGGDRLVAVRSPM